MAGAGSLASGDEHAHHDRLSHAERGRRVMLSGRNAVPCAQERRGLASDQVIPAKCRACRDAWLCSALLGTAHVQLASPRSDYIVCVGRRDRRVLVDRHAPRMGSSCRNLERTWIPVLRQGNEEAGRLLDAGRGGSLLRHHQGQLEAPPRHQPRRRGRRTPRRPGLCHRDRASSLR